MSVYKTKQLYIQLYMSVYKTINNTRVMNYWCQKTGQNSLKGQTYSNVEK